MKTELEKMSDDELSEAFDSHDCKAMGGEHGCETCAEVWRRSGRDPDAMADLMADEMRDES